MQHNKARRIAIDHIWEQQQQTICMQVLDHGSGIKFFDDRADDDGDCIVVHNHSHFAMKAAPRLVVAFPRGTSPKWIASALRKCAEIMGDPKASQVTDLGDISDELTHALRRRDGEVHVYNIILEYRRYLEEAPANERG
jgi:hypothetical protein